MDLHFENPKMLLMLWAIPALMFGWFQLRKRQRNRLDALIAEALRRKLAPPEDEGRFHRQLALLGMGLILAVVAASRPQWGTREEVVHQRGRDLLVALDVSRSMLATDVRPSRLERAKIDLVDLVRELRGDRVGLIAFRRQAVLLCPRTTDYAFFLHALAGVSPDSAPRGETDIGSAIRQAIDTFGDDGGTHKAMILISDGEDLKGDALAAAEEARRRGIVIFTVGLGSSEGSPIPDAEHPSGHLTHREQTILTRLDNSMLNNISKITGGAYIPLGTASMGAATLGTLYRDHLRAITTRDIEETLQRRRVERFQWFLFPAVCAFLGAALPSRGRLASRAGDSSVTSKRRGRRRQPPAAVPASVLMLGLLMGALPSSAMAQGQGPAPSVPPPAVPPTVAADTPDTTAPPGARAAQALFQRGDFEEAAQAFLAAARRASGTRAWDYRYNAAVAWYRAGAFDAAAEVLQGLVDETPERLARHAQGLGAALYDSVPGIEGTDAAALRERADRTRAAAEALRLAARQTSPRDIAQARRQAAVALHALREREDAARIAELLERDGSKGPGRLAGEMLETQRRIVAGAAAAATNTHPNRIAELEALAALQRQNADRWVTLKGQLLESPLPADATGMVQRAQLESWIEATRDRMRQTADALRDLTPEAPGAAAASEQAFYPLWKAIADYDAVLQQDLWRQTNAIDLAVMPDPARHRRDLNEHQQEALALSHLFRERFLEQFPEDGTAVPGPMGMPPAVPGPEGSFQLPMEASPAFTNRAEILERTAQVIALQQSALGFLATDDWEAMRADQQLAYGILKEIEDLLPRSQEGGEGSGETSEGQESADSREQPSGTSPEDQPAPPDEPDPQPEEAEAPPPEAPEDAAPEPQPDEEPAPADPDTEEIERMLERALQRERDHAAERQRRQQQTPSIPIDRDW